jgi:hypothetical protein
MVGNISFKSFRAVVTLLFFRIEFSSSWTSDTEFSIPKRKVCRASTFFVGLIENSFYSFSISKTFADVV